jgi:primosomal protein N' (replication factor Y)
MFIQVKLLTGFSQDLTYKVPDSLASENLVGKLVTVPFRTSTKSALVIKQMPTTKETFQIREIIALAPFPKDPYYMQFIEQLSQYHQVNPLHFIKRVQQFLYEKEMSEISINSGDSNDKQLQVTLTDEQQKVIDFLSPILQNPAYTPTVLHGVTGSGKTEVYKQLIKENFALKKTTLLLLPEVTLAIQFEKLMQKTLPSEISVFGFHSATSAKLKRQLWQHLLQEMPLLIIGVHLPILLPIANLGLIIIDEEHEIGYQEKKHPKINSKDAAILKAHTHKIPILLGSATPSLSSIYNVTAKSWRFFQLKNRFSGSFPSVKTVLLTDKKFRRNFWISKELENAINDRLNKKEQTIIFLNRRGFSFFVQCKACSFIFQCRNCSVSLTLHTNNQLHCHYCALNMQLPPECPTCKQREDQFLKKGIGTQQVVTILEKLFPQARIARADLDTTTKKKIWQQTLTDFEAGNLDILVGTQTITKGFHFPRVTLVGILWADLNLHFPIFNAAETTLQQLIQVAGRAGRQSEHSDVIVQTMIGHPIFNFLNEIDYVKFYETEMANRQMLLYPPYVRFVEIELRHSLENILENEAIKCMNHALKLNNLLNLQLQILGPAKPPVHKIKNIHSRKIYIKGNNITDIIKLFISIKKPINKSQIFFTPNPLS